MPPRDPHADDNTRTSRPPFPQVPASAGGAYCSVSDTPNPYTGGFAANVAVKNTSTVAWPPWIVGFSFTGGQKITSAWNTTATQSGATATFGIQCTWVGSNPSPLA